MDKKEKQPSGVVEQFVKSSTTLLIYPLFFPFLLIFYAFTSSVMNKDMGAVIYIFGLVVTLLNNYIINSSSKVIDKKGIRSEFCYTGIPFIPKNNLKSSPNMAVISYSFFFFLIPTFIRNIHYLKNPPAFLEYLFDKNKFIFLFFGLIMLFNKYSEKYFGCSNPDMRGLDLSNGFLVGMFSAWLLVLLFYVTGNKNLLITNRFMDNKVLCVVPTNKLFKCKNDSNVSAVVFSTNGSEPDRTDDKYYFGDKDLTRLDSIKLAGIWTYIHIYGKTDLVVYSLPNFKGEKLLIKYRDIKTKLITKNEIAQAKNQPSEQGGAYNPIIRKWEATYINTIKKFNQKIYEATRMYTPELVDQLFNDSEVKLIMGKGSIYPIGNDNVINGLTPSGDKNQNVMGEISSTGQIDENIKIPKYYNKKFDIKATNANWRARIEPENHIIKPGLDYLLITDPDDSENKKIELTWSITINKNDYDESNSEKNATIYNWNDTKGEGDTLISIKKQNKKLNENIKNLRINKNEYILENAKILILYNKALSETGTVKEKTETNLESEIRKSGLSTRLGKGTRESEKFITLEKNDIINKCLWDRSRCGEDPKTIISIEPESEERIGSIQIIKSPD